MTSTPVPYYTLPVDPWIKFTATTVGRDKLYRLIQYLAKFLAHGYFTVPTTTPSPKTHSASDDPLWTMGQRLNRLSLAVGMARKLFRLGKPVDFLQTIFKSQAIQDDVIRWCAIGRSLFLAGWLSLDTLQWLNAQRIIRPQATTMTTINRTAAKCWFIGLMFAVGADGYRLRSIQQRITVLSKRLVATGDNDVKKDVAVLQQERVKIILELVQDSLDLVIPASLLEWLPVNQSFVGLVGTITSLMGCWAAWPKS